MATAKSKATAKPKAKAKPTKVAGGRGRQRVKQAKTGRG